MAELTDRERDVLTFERQWWKYAGAKETAMRDLFGCSATRYYQELNGLLDRPEALRFDPMLIKRLLRLRTQRQRLRQSRMQQHPRRALTDAYLDTSRGSR